MLGARFRFIFSTYNGAGKGLILQCTGNEENLLDCTYTPYYSCWNGYASVNCTIAECAEEAVRLVGGMNETEGRVEICYAGNWYKVCGDSYPSQMYEEARVVCKQLGYSKSGIL